MSVIVKLTDGTLRVICKAQPRYNLNPAPNSKPNPTPEMPPLCTPNLGIPNLTLSLTPNLGIPKGADNIVRARCTEQNSQLMKTTAKHIGQFSNQGRTQTLPAGCTPPLAPPLADTPFFSHSRTPNPPSQDCGHSWWLRKSSLRKCTRHGRYSLPPTWKVLVPPYPCPIVGRENHRLSILAYIRDPDRELA